MSDKYFVLDVETTASQPEDSLVSIGIISMTSGRKDQFCMKPRFPITSVGLACHGVTNRAAAFYDPPKDALESLRNSYPELWEPSTVVMGWNVEFDKMRLNEELVAAGMEETKCDWVDAMRIAQKRISPKDIGNYKLDTVFCHLFEHDDNKLKLLFEMRAAHSALYDVMLTLEVILALMSEDEIFDDIVQITKEGIVLEVIPIGKYRGKEFGVLFEDMDYTRWLCNMCREKGKYPDLLHTLNHWGLTQDR